MGAYNCIANDGLRKPQTSETIRPKLTSKSNSCSSQSNDVFIMNHLKNNKQTDKSVDIDSLDNRRLVFVHLPGLYQSWRCVPSVLLYTSLMILPLKQEWIELPDQHVAELQDNICTPCGCSDIAEITDFMHLLQWKSSQNLVLCALDGLDPDAFWSKVHKFAPNPLVTPFWYHVSSKIASLYDHVEGKQYKPLTLEEEYWTKKGTFCSKYETKSKSILRELYFVTMQPKAMQEIIYQSNPKSLHPVIEYEHRKGDLHVNTIAHLSPVIEENEARFAINCVSPEESKHVRINIVGVTPEDRRTPSANVQSITAK
eukprot:92192_1